MDYSARATAANPRPLIPLANERKVGKCLLAVLFAMALPVILQAILVPHCSFSGSCEYNPPEQPSTLFIERPPEQFVVAFIQDQIAQEGTFPPGDSRTVASVTATHVRVVGFWTDWYDVANVDVAIAYTDGSQEQVRFTTKDHGASSLLGLDLTLFHASFGPLTQCPQASPGHWDC